METTTTITNLLSKLPTFGGVFAADMIPEIDRRPLGIIVNTDTSNLPGEHWIAIWFSPVDQSSPNTPDVEYFDPLGLPPIINEFANYLNKVSVNGWVYNPITLQCIDGVECGKLCEAFIIAKTLGLSITDFITMFHTERKYNESVADLIRKSIEFIQ